MRAARRTRPRTTPTAGSRPCLQHLAAGNDLGAITGHRQVRIDDLDRPLEDRLALNAVHPAADELCSAESESVEYRVAKIAINQLRVGEPRKVKHAVMP